MIHVVHVLTRTNIGGPSVMLVDLINGLDASRFRHTIIRGTAVEAEGDYLLHHQVASEVITLPALRRSIGVAAELRSLWHITKLLRELRPDIVHTHMAKAGIVGRLAAFLSRTPIRIHTFHGHLLHGYFSDVVGGLFIRIERLFRVITSHSLVVGNATRRDLIAARIVRESSSTAVLPGAKSIVRQDPVAVRKMHGLPVDVVIVGFVGRFTNIKRPDRFLSLASGIPNAHFVMFGNGPLREEVQRQAETHDNVSVMDFSTDLTQVFATVDLMVLTSDNEGVPLSLMEAAAAGVPVVSMRVGGVEEIVEHGVTGLLVDNDAELGHAVAQLVHNESMRASMGATAQRTIHERCSLTKYLSTHDELYTRLLTP